MRRRGSRRPTGRRHLGAGPLVVLGVVVIALFGTLFARLGQVQVAQAARYDAAAHDVNTRVVTVPAPRGRILDRHGVALAASTTSVAVTVARSTLLAEADGGRRLLTRLASALDLPFARLWGRTFPCGTQGAPAAPACWGGSPYAPIPVAEGVQPARALAVAELPEDYPGVSVVVQPVRTYPRPDGVGLAQVLGYLAHPTQAQVDASNGSVTALDLVGQSGLEKEYDAELRGTPGRVVVAVDPRGVVQREVSRVAPVPGRDLVTNLDVAVQAASEQALAKGVAAARAKGLRADSAAAVVLDTRTGGVVASASLPTYDPNVWTGGISAAAYAALTAPGSGDPLVNRVTESTYPPASTFKAISLPAAVSAGNDLHGIYPCPSSYLIGNRAFHNYESESHGMISLTRAIEVSCDTVFYAFAYRSWLAQGGLSAATDAKDPFVTLARQFGLGRATGIDLPGESAGHLPDRAWKLSTWQKTREETCGRARTGYPDVARTDPARAAYLKALATESCTTGFQFRAGDEANLAIGQGDTSTTPLQMAVAYAAIANGGTLVTPRVAEAFVDPGGAREPVPARTHGTVDIPTKVGDYLRAALRSAVVRGTSAAAFKGFPTDWPVAGKTGTGEIFGKQDVAWFASFAPYGDPQYAVVVVVSQGGTGGSSATPVNRDIQAALRTATHR